MYKKFIKLYLFLIQYKYIKTNDPDAHTCQSYQNLSIVAEI